MDEFTKLTYTKAEAAQILNIPETSINWLVRTGRLLPTKICKENRFAMKDLMALIENPTKE